MMSVAMRLGCGLMCPVFFAEAISETIKGNCLEMRSYSSDIKKLVSPVAMRSTSNRNGNGNGSGKKQSADDHAFATPDISSTN